MAATMRSARLHEPGKQMRVDVVDRPRLRPSDVLVQVKACGVIPNMNAIFSGRLWNVLPPLPAIVGLDAAGIVAEVGPDARNVAVGDRVYVNPLLSCGACHYCRYETPMLCSAAALQGYFGFNPESKPLLGAYPYGGFSEYMTAAPHRLVKLPPSVSFNHAARFGYFGTSFAGLRMGGVTAGSWVGINGITGTLGVGATPARARHGRHPDLGLGRNREVLEQLKALAPARIDTLALGDQPIADWLRERADGLGVDVLRDCPDAPRWRARAGRHRRAQAGRGRRHHRRAVEPLPLNAMRIMKTPCNTAARTGPRRRGAAHGERAGIGVFDLRTVVDRPFPLDGIR